MPKSHIEYANTSEDINTSKPFHNSKYPQNDKNVKNILIKGIYFYISVKKYYTFIGFIYIKL